MFTDTLQLHFSISLASNTEQVKGKMTETQLITFMTRHSMGLYISQKDFETQKAV